MWPSKVLSFQERVKTEGKNHPVWQPVWGSPPTTVASCRGAGDTGWPARYAGRAWLLREARACGPLGSRCVLGEPWVSSFFPADIMRPLPSGGGWKRSPPGALDPEVGSGSARSQELQAERGWARCFRKSLQTPVWGLQGSRNTRGCVPAPSVPRWRQKRHLDGHSSFQSDPEGSLPPSATRSGLVSHSMRLAPRLSEQSWVRR